MPSLAAFQRSFAQTLLSGVRGQETYGVAIAIYQNGWRKALVEALEANYPVVAALIGAESFHALALDFTGSRGSPTPVLAGFGSNFPVFLSRHSVLADVPYLADVARVERLATEAHLAFDADSMPLADFIERAERNAGKGLRLHPAVRFCWLESPARTIWEAHQSPDFAGCAPEWRAEGAFVHRPEGAVAVEPLSLGEHALLEALASGTTLERSLDRAAEADPAMNSSATLIRFARAGTFLSFEKED